MATVPSSGKMLYFIPPFFQVFPSSEHLPMRSLFFCRAQHALVASHFVKSSDHTMSLVSICTQNLQRKSNAIEKEVKKHRKGKRGSDLCAFT